jgi:hypothetical protein
MGEITNAQHTKKAVYVLDNAKKEAASRFGALSDVFDSGTIRHLQQRVSVPAGAALRWAVEVDQSRRGLRPKSDPPAIPL